MWWSQTLLSDWLRAGHVTEYWPLIGQQYGGHKQTCNFRIIRPQKAAVGNMVTMQCTKIMSESLFGPCCCNANKINFEKVEGFPIGLIPWMVALEFPLD